MRNHCTVFKIHDLFYFIFKFILFRLCWLINTLCTLFNPANTAAPTEGKKPLHFPLNFISSNTHFISFSLKNNRNPLACAVSITALQVLQDENLASRATHLGEHFRTQIRALNHPLVDCVRGRGLLNAVVIDERKSVRGRTAWQFCLLLKSRGVLAKPTHVNM